MYVRINVNNIKEMIGYVHRDKCVGLACPKPVINTKKELDKIEKGIVVVTVDNDIAKAKYIKIIEFIKL